MLFSKAHQFLSLPLKLLFLPLLDSAVMQAAERLQSNQQALATVLEARRAGFQMRKALLDRLARRGLLACKAFGGVRLGDFSSGLAGASVGSLRRPTLAPISA